MRSHAASKKNDLSSSDDEFEDGTQIEPFSCDSRKVVIVSGSRVGSGAPYPGLAASHVNT